MHQTFRHAPSFRIGCRALVFVAMLVFGVNRPASAQEWTELLPSGTPPTPRYQPRAVYDAATNRMLVFGGGASPNSNQTWALALGSLPQWTLVATSGPTPAPRVGPTSVYDSANSRMIVFGGGLGATSPCANDVWVLANANGVSGTPTWSQLSPSGGAPAPRWVSSAVYDPATNRMIIFGGNSCFSPFYNDVWVLTNANGLGGTPTWSQLSPTGPLPNPTGYHTAVYDAASNRMIVFGVHYSGVVSSEVWVLSNANGLGGTPAWTLLSTPAPVIPGRINHAAVYDAGQNQMTVFGGWAGPSIGSVNDTWVLSNANGLAGTPTWSQLNPSGPLPGPKEGMASAYDPASRTMIVFGGIEVCCGTNTTWALSLEPPNAPPTAVAGPNQTIRPGTPVSLNGNGSFDDNTATNLLSYSWSFTTLPAGSAATLSGANTMTPSFTPDVLGTYAIQLVVTDQGGLSSAPSEVLVQQNPPPTANAGLDKLVLVGSLVALTGTGADADGDALTYQWSFASKPVGSTATFSSPNMPSTTFAADVPGVFVARLTVSDPMGAGEPDDVQITVATPSHYAVVKLHSAGDIVEELPLPDVTNRGNQNAVMEFLADATAALNAGNLAGARHKIEQAIERTDGCALRGLPDPNGQGRDWIITCAAQGLVYPLLVDALSAIEP